MIRETIDQIQAAIQNAKTLDENQKKELLNLVSTLNAEVRQLSKTHPEYTQSIKELTEMSIHEAIREERDTKRLRSSLQRLSTSVEGFEGSHPKLVAIVSSLCLALSNV